MVGDTKNGHQHWWQEIHCHYCMWTNWIFILISEPPGMPVNMMSPWRFSMSALSAYHASANEKSPCNLYGNMFNHPYLNLRSDIQSAAALNEMLIRSALYKKSLQSTSIASLYGHAHRFHPYLQSEKHGKDESWWERPDGAKCRCGRCNVNILWQWEMCNVFGPTVIKRWFLLTLS